VIVSAVSAVDLACVSLCMSSLVLLILPAFSARAFPFGRTLKLTTLSEILCDPDNVLYNSVQEAKQMLMFTRNCKWCLEKLIVLSAKLPL